MTKISGVGYTQNGNQYKKSTVGKNVGTAFGLGALAVATRKANQSYIKKASAATKKIAPNAFALFKKFIKDGPSLGDKINAALKDAIKGTNVNTKFVNMLAKHKSARIAFVASGVALVAGLYTGLGRLVGHGVDKVIDIGAKKEADRNAAA